MCCIKRKTCFAFTIIKLTSSSESYIKISPMSLARSFDTRCPRYESSNRVNGKRY